MLTITETIPDFDTYEDYLGYRGETALFFDIETTGLSPSSAIVFLIGIVRKVSGSWQLTQWLAQRPADEALLLQAFSDAAINCDTLIHFNGSTFDLPFIKERARLLGRTELSESGDSLTSEMHLAEHSMDGKHSLDLYQRLRPLRQPLGLARMNQGSLEQFLGWPRKDRLSGKQMISLFQKYVASQEPLLRDLLLLHNHDDLLGMTSLLRLCAYSMLFDGQFTAVRASLAGARAEACHDQPLRMGHREHASPADTDPGIKNSADIGMEPPSEPKADHIESGCSCMKLHLTLTAALPREITLSLPGVSYTLTASGSQAVLSVPGFRGELRHFFPNWKDYYYLPLEDQAVHKSIAAFVDPQYRARATAANCCIKKSGLFFPQPEEFFSPAFKASCDSRELFFACPQQEDKAQPNQIPGRSGGSPSGSSPETALSLHIDQEKLASYTAALLRMFAHAS